MSPEQSARRRRLRAHARQLGDRHDARSRRQAIDHLVHECAYEHWHGMPFARFLAENDLLIEPSLGVAVTLEECEELAKDEGIDRWALASRFAHSMLPQVFRPDHPAFEVRFAREHWLKLEGLVESLPAEVFAATAAVRPSRHASSLPSCSETTCMVPPSYTGRAARGRRGESPRYDRWFPMAAAEDTI